MTATLSVVLQTANGAVKGVVQLSEEGREFVYLATKGGQLLGEILKQCDGSRTSGISVEIPNECISRYWKLGKNEKLESHLKNIRIKNLPDVEQDYDYVQVLSRIVRIYKPTSKINIFDLSWKANSLIDSKKRSDEINIKNSSYLYEYDGSTWSLAGVVLPSSETDYVTVQAGNSYLRLPYNEIKKSTRLRLNKENKIEGYVPKQRVVAMWTLGE